MAQVFLNPVQYCYERPVYVVLEVFRDNSSIYRMETTPRFAKQWNRINMISAEGFQFETNDYLIVYIFNPFKYTLYIDDISFSLWDKSSDI